MEAKELRIGNYFLDDENNISKCNGFNPFGHSIRCDEPEGCDILLDYFQNGKWHRGYECDINDCKPIEITADLLAKCGFVVEHTNGGFIKWKFGNFTLIDGRLIYPDNFGNPIIFLHQLQNIYYALTGTELEINL